jgi:hypothetical protein
MLICICVVIVNQNGRKSTFSQKKRYTSYDGHCYIIANFQDNMVRWSWNSTDEIADHEIDTIEDFEQMIQSEGWTEE